MQAETGIAATKLHRRKMETHLSTFEYDQRRVEAGNSSGAGVCLKQRVLATCRPVTGNLQLGLK
jgi:hypothetical protein